MTRRKILSGITITAIAAILVAWAPSVAYAGFPIGPAEVTRGANCGMPYINSDGGLSIWLGTFHQVVTNDGAGTGKATCKAKDIPNDTGSDYVLDITTVPSVGALCGAGVLGVTDIWEASISSGGNNDVARSTLQCHFPGNP